MWLLFLVILLGTLRVARAEPDNHWSTSVGLDEITSGDAPIEHVPDAEESDTAGACSDADGDEADEPDAHGDRGADRDDGQPLIAGDADSDDEERLAEGELAGGSEAREEQWLEGPDAREAALRSRASRLGRVDVGVTWRRAAPDVGPARHEVLLLATWRL